jgi:hypothetical protein
VLDQWAHVNGVVLDFIDPGKPTQNAFAESVARRVPERELVREPGRCAGHD